MYLNTEESTIASLQQLCTHASQALDKHSTAGFTLAPQTHQGVLC